MMTTRFPFCPTFACAFGIVLGLLLTTPLQAQEQGPSVAIRIVLAGTVQGDVTLLPPRQKSDKQTITYPRDAAAEGIGGTVKLKVRVDIEGNVQETETIQDSGDDRLLNAAIEGLRNTGLVPGTIDGTPKEMWVRVEITFNPGPIEGGDGAAAGDLNEDSVGEFVPVETPARFDRAELARILVYPEEAKEEGLEGTVIVKVEVDKNGKPLQALVERSTEEIFEENAVKAAMSLTYTPAVQNGYPLKMWITFPISFVLE